MTRDQLKEKADALEKPEGCCLLVVAGSHAYGLDDEQSDADFRGIVLSPVLDILCQKPAETISASQEDVVYHPLCKFFKLAAAGNPNVLEWLFVRPEDIVYLNQYGKMILENRHLFLSRKMADSYLGYAANSWKVLSKALQSRLEDERSIRLVQKHARHILRLLLQLAQALETGTFDTYCGSIENPLAVEEGTARLRDEYVQALKEAKERIDKALLSTPLPERADMDGIDTLHAVINLDWIGHILDPR